MGGPLTARFWDTSWAEAGDRTHGIEARRGFNNDDLVFMRWQPKSCGYDMGIIAHTSNISNILIVMFSSLPATSHIQWNGGSFLELSGAMGLQFFPVISGDIYIYGDTCQMCKPQGNYQKRTEQADELFFSVFFWGDEHDWTSQNPCESWCMLMSCMYSTSLWPMVVFLKILISCVMFEFRT